MEYHESKVSEIRVRPQFYNYDVQYLLRLMERTPFPSRGLDIMLDCVMFGRFDYGSLAELRKNRRYMMQVAKQEVQCNQGVQYLYTELNADQMDIPCYTQDLQDAFNLLTVFYDSEASCWIEFNKAISQSLNRSAANIGNVIKSMLTDALSLDKRRAARLN